MLLMLLIAVPLGLALAIAIDLADNRGERIETWIEDAHPVVARRDAPTTSSTSSPLAASDRMRPPGGGMPAERNPGE
jgi:hypothetical protein